VSVIGAPLKGTGFGWIVMVTAPKLGAGGAGAVLGGGSTAGSGEVGEL
jgi:hypothetical protein